MNFNTWQEMILAMPTEPFCLLFFFCAIVALTGIILQVIKEAKIKIFILIFLLIPSLIYAEEVTILKDGNSFTRTETCQKTKDFEAGNKVKMLINGEWIYVMKMKAKEFIPNGSLEPLQTKEDLDKDGNTDYIIIRVDTNEIIAKEKIEEK